jgi:hypothetical protein
MSENRNDGSGPLRVSAPEAIPKRDRLTDAQVEQVRELLAQEREALAREREGMLTATGEAVGKLLDQQREELKAYYENTIRALKIEMSALDVTVRELRALINAENAKLVDSSSSPPYRRNVN